MLTNIQQIACQKTISGGQTGVDRGALDACLINNFAYGGWCPKGRMAEDGRIDIKYKLNETEESNYSSRTYKNARDSNATLIITNSALKGGTLLTQQIATQMKKPVLILFPEKPDSKDSLLKMITFIQNNNVSTLNIPGPRKSEWIQGYQYSFQLVSDLIKKIQKIQQNPI
ncbi:molybdenum cofactor carrier [Maribellus comscasis]|uniref:Molybdenum cofactor carrier n=1 Tax=Maribellus comscasis TaxID=2681766 RepID=A0A6I6JKW3_9BACT|nr:putative molybdenum carrier protein [Maribellus comscasis]QGY43436.1 molybdenum cofactor carrier [Maribellus comscasis]